MKFFFENLTLQLDHKRKVVGKPIMPRRNFCLYASEGYARKMFSLLNGKLFKK
jgi:hypothetical protein